MNVAVRVGVGSNVGVDDGTGVGLGLEVIVGNLGMEVNIGDHAGMIVLVGVSEGASAQP